MSLYFINTFSRQLGTYAIEGVELPNRAALATMLRQTLTEMARDEGGNGCEAFTALAADVDGKPVMSATLTLVVSTPRSRTVMD